MALCSSSRPVPLATGSWIPTASVVRCYTAMQAFERLLWFPLVLSGNSALLLLSFLCGGTQNSLDLRDPVNRLCDSNSSCSDRIPLSMSTRCSLIRSCCMQWSSGAIDRRLQCSWCIVFFFLLLIFSCYRL